MLKQRGIHEDEEFHIKCIILDFSCLTFVDPSGVGALVSLHEDYESLGISMYIAGCSGKEIQYSPFIILSNYNSCEKLLGNMFFETIKIHNSDSLYIMIFKNFNF